MSPSASNAQFDIGPMITASWEIFKNNLGPLLGGAVVVGGTVVIVALVIPVILILIGGNTLLFSLLAAGLAKICQIGVFILAGPLLAGLYKLCLDGVRGHPLDFGDVFWGFKNFLNTFLAYLVITIFTMVGMIFCIIPGFLVAILYLPTYLFIIDQGLDFWDAMEASRKMVMNNFGQWLLLGVVGMVMNLAGVLACGIGSFVTMSLVLLVVALAYEQEREAVPLTTASPASPAI